MTFTTSAGTVNPTSTTTNDLGVATTQLNSSAQADVTATAGAQTGKVTIAVRARADIGYGLAESVFDGGPNHLLGDGRRHRRQHRLPSIEFGDGGSQSLGPLSSAARTAAHPYSSPGVFTATVTATDANGERTNRWHDCRRRRTQRIDYREQQHRRTAGDLHRRLWRYVGAGSKMLPGWTTTGRQTTTAPTTQRVFETRGTKTIRVDVFGISGTIIGTATAQINIS